MPGNIKIRVDRARVGVALLTETSEAGGFMCWKAAQEAAREIRELAKTSLQNLFYGFRLDGRMVYFDFERSLAVMLADALHRAGHLAEEHAKAEQIILDTAILARAGLPVGLTNDPRMLEAAGNEAAWNSAIRKSALGAIPTGEVFGTPSIRNSRRLQ